ncbi:uncharacterized protein EV420DRAFT_1621507 [Desarmillaria tabescens]|uniref:Aldolase n=1 Tax=Armillaria tabescens TaxID=1929756 RepID=A0AA39N110_ARMTA|nr:uncharacterized protein EV420DRAFT_1621507 [Desarmillaria tabescens]KAK0453992.1 hypothetical protein EV420DRAFT_1621507 [Desarmillaria tabescens]
MPSPPPFGHYVPTVCFFDENEELDVSAINPAFSSSKVQLHSGGVAGVIVQGTNDKAQHLSHEECNRREKTQKLCVDAKDAGADYALILSPSTFPSQMSVPSVIRFHHEVADASPIPTMIYNFPTVTAGLDRDSDALVALAKHPNIVGAKLTCGNIAKLHRIISSVSASKIAVLAGKADFVLPGLLASSSGCITALSNLTPKLHGRLFYLWRAGKGEEAMKLQATLAHADWALHKLGGIGGVKKVVSKAYGYGTGKVRTPLKEAMYESLLGNQHYETLMDLIRMEERLYSKL